jgi:hypothetical protein
VQPETSSSYLGSVICQLLVSAAWKKLHTAQNGAVSSEEAVLEGLFDVALLEGLLFCYNLVQVLACVDGYLVAAMTVVYTEESQSLVGLGGLTAVESGLQIEDTRVGIFHADAPALHRGGAEDEVFAIAGL